MAYSDFGMLTFLDEDDDVLNELSVRDANGNETNMDNDPENNQGDTTDYTAMDDDSNDNGAANPPAETPEAPDTGEDNAGDTTDYTDLGSDDAGDAGAENPDAGDQTDYTDLGGDTGDDNGDNTAGTDSGDGGVSDDTDYTDLGGDDPGADGGETAGGDEDAEASDGDGEEPEEGDGEGEDEGDELAKIEDELFSDLTSEQNAIKDKELKRLFIELYKMCDTTVNRINAIAKTDNNMRILTFCAKKIIELRDSIDYHLNETYWTKLYLDNLIIYKTCIAQYNNVNEILKKLIPDEYKDTDIEDMKDEAPKELDELNAEDDEDNEFNPDDDNEEIEDLNIQGSP